MRSASALSGVSERLQATTFMPKAVALLIISWPIRPMPSRPRVEPKTPAALAYFFLFQMPRRRSRAPSTRRRSIARRCAKASSATAIEFLPGQLATWMPRREAPSTSIVLTPAPARITRARAAEASRCRASTRVLRTTRISGWVLRSASSKASSSRSGSLTTSRPISRKRSRPVGGNLSAIRIFTDQLLRIRGPRARSAAWARTRWTWGAARGRRPLPP